MLCKVGGRSREGLGGGRGRRLAGEEDGRLDELVEGLAEVERRARSACCRGDRLSRTRDGTDVLHDEPAEASFAGPDKPGLCKLAVREKDVLEVELEDATLAKVLDGSEDRQARKAQGCNVKRGTSADERRWGHPPGDALLNFRMSFPQPAPWACSLKDRWMAATVRNGCSGVSRMAGRTWGRKARSATERRKTSHSSPGPTHEDFEKRADVRRQPGQALKAGLNCRACEQVLQGRHGRSSARMSAKTRASRKRDQPRRSRAMRPASRPRRSARPPARAARGRAPG